MYVNFVLKVLGRARKNSQKKTESSTKAIFYDYQLPILFMHESFNRLLDFADLNSQNQYYCPQALLVELW